MSIIEQIKAEIERLKKAQEVSEDKDYAQYELDVACGYDMACDDILSFLSALEPEKPMNQEGLDQEIIKCWQNWLSPSNQKEVEGVLPKTEFAMYARHFTQWQKEQDEMSKVNYEGARAVYDNTVQHLQEKIDEKYELGKKDMREQMLNDAVEGVLVDNVDGTQEICLHGNRYGDKVRVIILPKED